MYVLYFLGIFLPAVVGAVRWYLMQKVVWLEWLASTGVGLLVAFGFQMGLFYGMVGDKQVYSGQIVKAKHFSAWLEYYEYAVYRTEEYGEEEEETDADGHEHEVEVTKTREVFDHWEPTTREHPDSWAEYSNISTEYEIDAGAYQYARDNFGGEHPVAGDRSTMEHNSRMISGDPNDYEAPDATGFIIPVTAVRSWTNKVKCCPSVFSYAPVPKTVQVFPYPYPTDPFHSNRLLGTASSEVGLLPFDRMCARLGPVKRVNVILVGFGDKPEPTAHYQEAAWVGGKKNDLVLCYGGSSTHPDWTYCFGWTENAIVKRNLETIALNEGVNDKALPDFEDQIKENYVLKDWKKFDYLTVEPPVWSYWAELGVIIVTQALFWFGVFEVENSDDLC